MDGELATLAWLYHMNHGIFMTPGVEEEWTLSIAHSDEDIERYVAAFETFARDVTAQLSRAVRRAPRGRCRGRRSRSRA